MDKILRENLPIELVYNIMKDVHNRYMTDLIRELCENVVWIRTKEGEYSFLIGKTSRNPYYVLRDFKPTSIKFPNQSIHKRLHYNYFREN